MVQYVYFLSCGRPRLVIGCLIPDGASDLFTAFAGEILIVGDFSIFIFIGTDILLEAAISSPRSGLDGLSIKLIFFSPPGWESRGARLFLGRMFCGGGDREGDGPGVEDALPGFLVSRELKKLERTLSEGGGVEAVFLAAPSTTCRDI